MKTPRLSLHLPLALVLTEEYDAIEEYVLPSSPQKVYSDATIPMKGFQIGLRLRLVL